MRAEKIFDIQSEINKHGRVIGTPFYVIKEVVNKLGDTDIAELNAQTYLDFGKSSKVVGFRINTSMSDIFGGIDNKFRIIPKPLLDITKSYVAVNSEGNKIDVSDEQLSDMFYSIAPYYYWDKTSRAVYTADRGLLNSFKDQIDGLDTIPININAMKHLPYRYFYLDCRAAGQKDYPGAFVGTSTNNNVLSLWISLWNSDYNTLSGTLARLDADENGIVEYKRDITFEDKAKEDYIILIFNLIAYIGSVEPDITEVVEHVGKKRKTYSTGRKEYKVGYRIGQKLEAARNKYKYLCTHGNGTKRPHIRKAHWHTYWVGRKGTEDRKKLVKWVAETYVNCDSSEMIDIVDRVVDKTSKITSEV